MHEQANLAAACMKDAALLDNNPASLEAIQKIIAELQGKADCGFELIKDFTGRFLESLRNCQADGNQVRPLCKVVSFLHVCAASTGTTSAIIHQIPCKQIRMLASIFQ